MGGGSHTGTTIYKTTGKTCACVDGSQQISCSGSDSPSVRRDCNNCGLRNYEATAKVQFGGGCGCGEEATIKHLGPRHQRDGVDCCWVISNVEQNGDCFFGAEGPHPDTDNSQVKLGNVGNLRNKQVGIKSIVWKTLSGWHQELWVDTTASMTRWRKMGFRNFTSWGYKKTTSQFALTGPQQVEFRVDCSQAKWLAWSVQEIIPPVSLYTEVEDKKPDMGPESNLAQSQPVAYATYLPKPVELVQQLEYNTIMHMPIVKETFLTKRLMNRR